MIVKNEGATLGDSLASTLPFVDQYVIGVDDKSSDNTFDEACRFVHEYDVDADVHFFTWENDFSKARNAVIERAKGDFIFTLDGHERVIAGHEKLKRFAADPQGNEVFAIELQSIKGNYRTSFWQERMFLKKYRYHNACHNVIVYDPDKAARLMGVILEHDRSDELTAARKAQRLEMNIPPLLERINRGDRRAKAQLPQEYISLRDWPKATGALLDYLTEKMEDKERYQVFIKLAMCYFWSGDLEGAEDALMRSVVHNDDKRNAHFIFLADIYMKRQQWEIAETLLLEALRIPKPDVFWFCYPKFYHSTPNKMLKVIYDHYNLAGDRQAAN